ncbi:hypothetical protein M3Y99_00460000 [Aphelenchoides fujianensis]|nr:hypothetical protein M3Y99_00460000 [Aphelenchoides fujianensis]
MATRPQTPPPPYTPVEAKYDDRRYRCWCNTHVHKGTIAICIFGILNSFVAFAAQFFVVAHWWKWITMWPPLINICLYACLLIGNRKKKVWLYYPFLFVHLVILFFMVLIAALLFVAAGYAENQAMDELCKLDTESTTDCGTYKTIIVSTFIGMGLIDLIGIAIQIYFYYVVFRAFRYLKRVLLNPMSNLPRV